MSGARAVLATVKDEAPYLVEWVAHYRSLGFDDIRIASNDCTDGSDAILACLDAAGVIRHLENSDPGPGENPDPQNRAYARFWADPGLRGADWVLVADADEFLNIHAGDGTLDALFAALGGRVDAVSAPWRVFGNGGVARFADAPVTAQFTAAAPPGVQRTQRLTAFKTLFRPQGVRRPGVHRPRLAPRFARREAPFTWVNGSGADVTGAVARQGWRFTRATYGGALVQMNHYMIRSSEAFLMKRWRGTANSADAGRIDFGYFDTFNCNAAPEPSITRHRARLEAGIAALYSGVPGLAALHAAAVAFHRERIAALAARLAPPDAAKLGLG